MREVVFLVLFATFAGLTSSQNATGVDPTLDFSKFTDATYASVKDIQLNIGTHLTKGFALAQAKRLKQTADLGTYGESHTMSAPFGFIVKRAKPAAAQLSSCQGLGLLETARYVANSQNWTKDVAYSALKSVNIPKNLYADLLETCDDVSTELDTYFVLQEEESGDCLKDKYRTANGTCNNAKHFKWGSALEAFQRCILPEYEDGIGEFRGLSHLPNPRHISFKLRGRPVPEKSTKVTQMAKLWGQFTDHDLVKTPETPAALDADGKAIDIPCCENGDELDSTFEDCRPIKIPEDDPFYHDVSVKCLRFVRSSPFSGTTALNTREQHSEITAFLDGSNVYGSSIKEQKALRTLTDGLLKTGSGSESGCSRNCPLSYLPEDETDEEGENFFAAGDDRVNEQPSLASMHTLWVRFHNKVAALILQESGGTDEIVFQETRRIIGALMQHITYTEFLPPILGVNFLQENGLSTPNTEFQDSEGYNTRYDIDRNPTVLNVFGAAALRFGHSLISNEMMGKKNFTLDKTFFDGQLQTKNNTHPSDILEGEFLLAAEGMDAVFDAVLSTKLLAEEPFANGNDLMSLNLNRGRDHGLPGYNKWREFCNLQPFADYEQMKSELDPFVCDMFETLYDSIDEVDLYAAALAETPTADGILGPTFSCLLLKQFKNSKYGDRFWYENGPSIHTTSPEAVFTIRQLEILRKSSLAAVLCQATNIKSSSLRPMEVSGSTDNPLVPCEDFESGSLIESLTNGDWWLENSDELPDEGEEGEEEEIAEEEIAEEEIAEEEIAEEEE